MPAYAAAAENSCLKHHSGAGLHAGEPEFRGFVHYAGTKRDDKPCRLFFFISKWGCSSQTKKQNKKPKTRASLEHHNGTDFASHSSIPLSEQDSQSCGFLWLGQKGLLRPVSVAPRAQVARQLAAVEVTARGDALGVGVVPVTQIVVIW